MRYLRHLGTQWPVIRALLHTATRSTQPTETPALPGPWQEDTLAPRPQALLRDAVRWSGGDPGWYRGIVPAYLFPQWAVPLAGKAMSALPYPLTRILNAGCKLTIHQPLPADEPLRCRARLARIEDARKGKRFAVEIETGTASAPGALSAELHTYLPQPNKATAGDKPAHKKRPQVPLDVRELSYRPIHAQAGLDFALLTGDINPIHWLPPYARMFGFKRCILHGFGSFALTCEAIHRALLTGDTSALQQIEVRFVRPLLLPARVGVYVRPLPSTDTQARQFEVFLGDAPGGTLYLQGTFSLAQGVNQAL